MRHQREIAALLAQMDVTRDLPEGQRERLVSESRLTRVASGRRITRDDHSGFRLFLVDGHVLSTESGGGSVRLDSCLGLTPPIELLGSADPATAVVTETTCVLLELPHAALEAVRGEAVEVSDIELDDAESAFLAELYELISTNRLELPARPEVAIRIQQIAADPETGVDELTEAIQSDGTLAGAVLHVANSPRFRATKDILSVRDAVIRLGFDNTRLLATNLALRQMFKANYKVCREAMTAVWNESVLCSVFSCLLSRRLQLLNPERALLAGLIASIGAVPIIQFVDKAGAPPQRTEIEHLIDKLRSITGVLVINYWGLGADLVAVAEHSAHWEYRSAAPDYASIVIVARWAALHHVGQSYPPAETVPAFAVLGLQIPAPGAGIAELDGSAEALAALQRMFDI